jgi:hypothetical protein
VAVLAATLDVVEDLVGDESTIDERDRVVGKQRPKILGEFELGGRARSELDGRQEVRAEDHQGDRAYLRIRGSTATGAGTTECGFVLFGVRDTERGAVDSMNGQAAPAVFVGRGGGPIVGGVAKQDCQGFGPQPVSGLYDGATRHPSASLVRLGQHEVEVSYDGLDRAISKQPHADDGPDGVFGRQLATPYGGRSSGL